MELCKEAEREAEGNTFYTLKPPLKTAVLCSSIELFHIVSVFMCIQLVFHHGGVYELMFFGL